MVVAGTVNGYYQYSGGTRIRKVVEKSSGTEERVYLGSYERYRKYDTSGTKIVERDTVHIADDTGRVAMLEVRNVGSSSDDNYTAQSLKRFIYSNHLQSSNLELNESGAIISYEEYHPYGTTAYQAKSSTIAATAKRYRYTGKERDEESGLNYHGARYYAPWLCRWTAVDPLESKYAGWSAYQYCTCNPIMNTDSTGEGNDDDKPKNVNGYTVKTVILDTEGHALPEGTKLPYSESNTNTMLTEHKKNLDKGEVTAGTQVVRPAQSDGGMATVTATYRMGWGAKDGKLLLWGYQDTFNSSKEQKHEEQKAEDLVTLSISEPTKKIEPNPVKLKFDEPEVDKVKKRPLATRTEQLAQGSELASAKVAQEKRQFAERVIDKYKSGEITRVDISINYPEMTKGLLKESLPNPSTASEIYDKTTSKRMDTWGRNSDLRQLRYPPIGTTFGSNLTSQLRELSGYIRSLVPGARVIFHPINIGAGDFSWTIRVTGYDLPRK